MAKDELLEQARREWRVIAHKHSFLSLALIKWRFYCRNYGLGRALRRSIIHIIFRLHQIDISDFFYMLRLFFARGNESGDYEPQIALSSKKLKLVLDRQNRSFHIYWGDIKLTKDCGIASFVGCSGLGRWASNTAQWRVTSFTPTSAQIELRWKAGPLAQRWKISIGADNSAVIDISFVPLRNLMVDGEEAVFMLSQEYTRWINSYEKGEFPQIIPGEAEWKDIPLYNLASKLLAAWSESLPNFLIDFSEMPEHSEPRVRNSDFGHNLRCLLVLSGARRASRAKYYAGREYFLFKGQVKVDIDDYGLQRLSDDCKTALYKKRADFIEEKTAKRQAEQAAKPLDVLLVNLPWKKGACWGVRAGSRWPHIKDSAENAYLPFPFFLAYTAAILLKQKASVRIIDALAEKMETDDFISLVKKLEPRLVIAEVSTPSLYNDLEILRKIKPAQVKIAVCGPEYNITAPGFLGKYPFIDFVLYGEYEQTACELFDCLKNEMPLSGVKGLIYRQAGRVMVNPARPLVSDLDSLPWPLREELPMAKYVDAPGGIPFPSVQMWASRGCPFKCNFCAWPQLLYYGNGYRAREPKRVVDEMEYLIKERRFKSVYFDDDTFNVKKESVLAICDEIINRRLRVPWAVMARADLMDEETLLRLKDAGLAAVKYGVESAHQEILDNAGKKMDLKYARKMIDFTKSIGIKTHLTFTFGLPGETQETIKKTIDYAIALNPHSLQYSIMTPLPGTRYYRQLSDAGCILSDNWADYDGAQKSVINTRELSAGQLEEAKNEAIRRWERFRRKRRMLIFIPFDPEIRNSFRRSLADRGLLFTLRKSARYIMDVCVN